MQSPALKEQLPKGKFVSQERLPYCPSYHPHSELKLKSGKESYHLQRKAATVSKESKYFFEKCFSYCHYYWTTGCYPNISEEQLQAAEEVLNCIKTEELNFNIDNEVEFLKVLRFLRARKFNVSQRVVLVKWHLCSREYKIHAVLTYDIHAVVMNNVNFCMIDIQRLNTE